MSITKKQLNEAISESTRIRSLANEAEITLKNADILTLAYHLYIDVLDEDATSKAKKGHKVYRREYLLRQLDTLYFNDDGEVTEISFKER